LCLSLKSVENKKDEIKNKKATMQAKILPAQTDLRAADSVVVKGCGGMKVGLREKKKTNPPNNNFSPSINTFLHPILILLVDLFEPTSA